MARLVDPVLASLTSQLTDAIGRHGAYAVLVIMAVDALFPAASELTMLYAGALAAGAIGGRHPLFVGHALSLGAEAYVVLAAIGTVGYLLGALLGWWIGRTGGRPLLERHGRWLHLRPENLARAEDWFERRGRWAVFLGRITPVIRSFVSIPAGTLGIRLLPYTLLTLAGSAIWCFGFAAAGWGLGRSYDSVHHAFGFVDGAVVGLAVVVIVGFALHRRRRRR